MHATGPRATGHTAGVFSPDISSDPKYGFVQPTDVPVWNASILELSRGVRFGYYEDAVDDELRGALQNLHTYYRVDSFTSDDFAKQLEAVREETDLIVLDHFHYVDSDDANENRGHKRIVKQIRDSALRAERPVVVVGHVRKSDPKFSPLVPTEEAFHGSSDLVKIATKAIMLAPDYTTETGSPSRWSTYMQVVKCRQDSSLTRYVARINYDTRTDSYEEFYALGRLTDNGREFTGLDRDAWPSWKE